MLISGHERRVEAPVAVETSTLFELRKLNTMSLLMAKLTSCVICPFAIANSNASSPDTTTPTTLPA